MAELAGKIEATVATDTQQARSELLELQELGRQVRRELEGVNRVQGSQAPLSHPALGATRRGDSLAKTATYAIIPGSVLQQLIASKESALETGGAGTSSNKNKRKVSEMLGDSRADGKAGKSAADLDSGVKMPKPRSGGLSGWVAGALAANATSASKFGNRLKLGEVKLEQEGLQLGPIKLGQTLQFASLARIAGPAFGYVALFHGAVKASEAVNVATRRAFDHASKEGVSLFESLNAEFGKVMHEKIGSVAKGVATFFVGGLGELAQGLWSVSATGASMADEFFTGNSKVRQAGYAATLQSAHLAIQDTVDSLLGNPTTLEKVRKYDSEREKALQDVINRAKDLAKQDAENLAEAMRKMGFPGNRRRIYRDLEDKAEDVRTRQAIIAFNEAVPYAKWEKIIGVDQGDQ